LSYLRALAINTLIQDAVSIFMENETAILAGDFHVSLLEKSTYDAQIRDIIDLSVRNIYQAQEVVEKEIAGYTIIADILDVYVHALVKKKKDNASNYHNLILQTLPEFYRQTSITLYEILLNTCCYVASLSDSSAVHIHNKIKGRQL
jgi:dGTPase